MRSEIGKLTLDKTLAERNQLNSFIVEAINDASSQWGIKCLRYEIRDIQPPESVVKAMHSQVSAERQKRASILESEGLRQSAINKAEGDKQATILASEADRTEKINRALGEAEALLARSQASAKSIELISQSIKEHGDSAVSLMVAEKYMDAFAAIAKQSTTLMLPASTSDPASLIAQAMGVFKAVSNSNK
jgi:regulator of protease activity HflC (stomatin/prohibitin superfamily)